MSPCSARTLWAAEGQLHAYSLPEVQQRTARPLSWGLRGSSALTKASLRAAAVAVVLGVRVGAAAQVLTSWYPQGAVDIHEQVGRQWV